MTQTKTDRQAAAKKATATRYGNRAGESLDSARNSAETAFKHAGEAVTSIADAVVYGVRSVVTRAQTALPGS
jgi:ElaB/YqjD/DUF883 family membrane-anchored ribosome-binding protein